MLGIYFLKRVVSITGRSICDYMNNYNPEFRILVFTNFNDLVFFHSNWDVHGFGLFCKFNNIFSELNVIHSQCYFINDLVYYVCTPYLIIFTYVNLFCMSVKTVSLSYSLKHSYISYTKLLYISASHMFPYFSDVTPISL